MNDKKRNLTEQEQTILENIKTAMEKLPPEKLPYLVAFSEGMAAVAGR